MGNCSFVELRKLKFCACYSKGDFKKAWQILLGAVCRDGASPLPVHGWVLFSLGQKWQWQCIWDLWKRGVCSMPGPLGSSVRLSGAPGAGQGLSSLLPALLSCSTAGLHPQAWGKARGQLGLCVFWPWRSFPGQCAPWMWVLEPGGLSWQTKGHVLHLEIVLLTFYPAEKGGVCFCWSFIFIPIQRRSRQKLTASLKTLSSSGIFLAEIIITF